MKETHGMFWTLLWKQHKLLPAALVILSLCGIFFYLGGIFGFKIDSMGMQEPTTDVKLGRDCVPVPKIKRFKECSRNMSDITPCTDPEDLDSQNFKVLIGARNRESKNLDGEKCKILISDSTKWSKRWFRYDRHQLAYMERHCPPPSKRLECLVPPPPGYKVPIRWPQSRDECWYRNIPYDWIIKQKADQRWMLKKGEKFLFPGGGTMFATGADKYLDRIEELIPEMKTGSIRTALDTGCGVASWGGYLLDRGILTMSLAPKDKKVGQVQFALERGIPAMIGILSTQRLPYPSAAFDMAHCSRCLIHWTDSEGLFLLEVDRVLRPGGFWILSGPPINYKSHWKGWNTTEEQQKTDFDNLSGILERMCYKMHGMKDDTAVWQKPLDNTCYENLEENSIPPLCDGSTDPDASWYVPMHPCIVKQKHNFNYLAVGKTSKWPERLTDPPERAGVFSGGSRGLFERDIKLWVDRLKYYKTVLPQLGNNSIRNVMDMNTKYGGFAASLINDPVWVMNVVSSYGANSLGAIYDRGLIGTIHDWCEAFSTYPRTYDLLYLHGLFSEEGHRCEMKYVMLEMDRILRPNGYVLMRDTSSILDIAGSFAHAMYWNCRQHPIESPVYENEDANQKLLMCQKDLRYYSSE